MTRGARLPWSLVAAIGVHTALAAWIARGATRGAASESAVPDGATPADAIAFTVEEMEEQVGAEAREEASPMSAPLPPSRAEAVARADVSRGAARAPGAAAGSASPLESGPPAASADDGTWSFSASGAPDGASGAGSAEALSGDRLSSAVSAGVRATVAEDAARRARSPRILPVFSDRDIELGLVPGGAWVGLTRDHVRQSVAPTVGSALLEFTTDRSGVVARVRVVDASSDRAAWDTVAAELEQRAKSLHTRVPQGADGVAVTLEVTSKLTKDLSPPSLGQSIGKIVGAITDPADAIVDSQTPQRRIVAVRIVRASAF
jgi:hypothetical protein